MSIAATKWAWLQDLPPTAKLVLLALADHADDWGVCWPSLSRLVSMTGLSRSSTARALASLDGKLILRDRSKGGVGHSTRYQLMMEQSHPETIKRSHHDTVLEGNDPTVTPNSPTVTPKQSHSDTQTVREPSKTISCAKSFAKFWAVYPKKRAKHAAMKAWRKKGVHDQADLIIEDVKRRTKRDPEWTKEGGKFIPYPSTYLNGKRWEDEITPGNVAARPSSQSLPAEDVIAGQIL